jgi:transposase-like zinc-binding protein/putative transposase
LGCGILDQGFARVRCDRCHTEFLVAFSCKTRLLCPSCHAKRLEIWSDWLEHELLYAVPHRQYVFTVPKRLRPSFLHDRRLLGVLCRVAYRTLRDFLRVTFREPDVAPGAVASIQTFGSLANFHPHLHLVVTDGVFRPDGTFLHLGFHDIEVLTEAFRRAVLREFVRRELLLEDDALSMLSWPHSGFHVHHSVRLEADDALGILQLARYAARAPVALERAMSQLVGLTRGL